MKNDPKNKILKMVRESLSKVHIGNIDAPAKSRGSGSRCFSANWLARPLARQHGSPGAVDLAYHPE